MYNIGFNRLVKPWLHPDFIYNTLQDKTTSEEIVRNLNSFIQEVCNTQNFFFYKGQK